MAEKVSVNMVLKVDLQCPCCYKKVKKILCKFPQIRDQVYDEKANTVTITVVCCSPEKIRDKLCCKGAKVIKSIEIKEPPNPKPIQTEKPKEPEKSKEPEKPKAVVTENPKEPEKPKGSDKPKEPEKPKVIVIESPNEPEKPKEPENSKEADKPKEKPTEKPNEAPKPEPPKKPEPPAPHPPTPEPSMGSWPVPVNGFPPVRTCCEPCYEGYGGGPCYHGYAPPRQYYDVDYYGYGSGYGSGYSKGCPVTRCDYYFSDENPRGCSIM
ncbi:hypothetical protein OROMI_022582 [Orobanche minor]